MHKISRFIEGKDVDTNGIFVSKRVIASVAAMAAEEVEGVIGVDRIAKVVPRLGRVRGSEGVNVRFDEGNIELDIYLRVRYGEDLPKIAERAQNNIRRAVEHLLGMTVGNINVHVSSLDFSGR